MNRTFPDRGGSRRAAGVSLADAARVLAAWDWADDAGLERMLEALGFERRADPPKTLADLPPVPAKDGERTQFRQSTVTIPSRALHRRALPFWRMVTFEPSRLKGERGRSGAPAAFETRGATAPPLRLAEAPLSLVPREQLLPRLFSVLAEARATDRIDVDRLLARWARGEAADPIPWKHRRAWPSRIALWLDRSAYLAPVLDDQVELYGWLKGLITEPIDVRLLPRGIEGGPEAASAWRAEPGRTHLFVSDLGVWGGPSRNQTWQAFGHALSSRGIPPLALALEPGLSDGHRQGPWAVLSWAKEAGALPLDEDRYLRYRALLSVFPAITPNLMRWVRRNPQLRCAGPIAWEHRLWSEAADRNRLGLSFLPEVARALREELRARKHAVATEDLRVLGAIAVAHEGSGDLSALPALWAEALTVIAGLSPERILPEEVEQRVAKVWRAHLGRWSNEPSSRPWLRRAAHRSRFVLENLRLGAPTLADAVDQVFERVDRDAPAAKVLAGADLERRAAAHRRAEPRTIGLDDGRYGRLELRPSGPSRSSHLGGLPAGADLVFAERREETSVEQFRVGDEPIALPYRLDEIARDGRIRRLRAENPWAAEAGEDDFGPWAGVDLLGVRFRMRWVPPGTFWMGSPEDEEGRVEHEGPRHQVTLTEGYWMAETPCTQALWEAVMGENPSYFKGAERPVENVSWDDVQVFLRRANEAAPGLELRLPTEAQWERACRAGTDTATYAGDNDPETLGTIAWYLDNSNLTTHPVGEKAPNPLGLFDMLGQVYEWCQDATDFGPYPGLGPRSEPVGQGGALRVLRGGSWLSGARGVRAAFRFGSPPGLRLDDVGFRFSRGQTKRAEPSLRLPAERPELARAEPGGRGGSVDAGLGVGLILRTDRARVRLEPFERPPWAHGVGRDRFGLFADVRPPGTPPEAWLKLRWIPPGTFWRGSAEDEPGRWDYEGPRHRVTLTAGYWLADAPCTQALWTAVMEENPSYLQEPERPWLTAGRPVEQVSWDEVQTFLGRLSERGWLPGAALPTEAQWECACRAGTETATYAGAIDIRGQRDAPVLDAIAWYGGNSGVGFELGKGYDASRWNEKQYPHTTAGTRWVRSKAPNPWGLHDTLGNVWEWCADSWAGDAYKEPEGREPLVDPTGPERGARRVIRGGSWYADARDCRAAYRSGSGPDDRLVLLGFRVSRGQAEPSSSARSAAGGGADPLRAEPEARAKRDRPSFSND